MQFHSPIQLLFLLGATGDPEVRQPVSELLVHPAAQIFFGWPGFSSLPEDPEIRGMDDLVTRVVAVIDQPTLLLAQSMGGVVALRAALQRPALVTHLVMAVTSGGLDTTNSMHKTGVQHSSRLIQLLHPGSRNNDQICPCNSALLWRQPCCFGAIRIRSARLHLANDSQTC